MEGAAPARAASRVGVAGQAGGCRALAARRSKSGPRPVEPGRAGQGEAAEGGPARAGACVRVWQLPYALDWRGSERGGSGREVAAAEPRLRAPCALPSPAAARPLRPPLSSPRLLLSLVSPPLFRPAPLPPAPGPRNPAGPGPLPRALSAGPGCDQDRGRPPLSPGAQRLPDLSDRGLSGGSALAAGQALSWAVQTVAAAPDAARAGARTSWVRTERVPGPQRCRLTLGRADTAGPGAGGSGQDRAKPGRCQAWGIPGAG